LGSSFFVLVEKLGLDYKEANNKVLTVVLLNKKPDPVPNRV